MSGKNMSKATAIQEANSFVQGKLQDSTSPSHQGFQTWRKGIVGQKAAGHVLSENRYPSGQRRQMLEGATQWMLDAAISGDIPKEVYHSQTGDLQLPKKYTHE